MKRIYVSITCLLMVPLLLLAQQQRQEVDRRTCASDKVLLNSLKDDPVQLQRFEKITRDWIEYSSRDPRSISRSAVVLPVVFHLVTDGTDSPGVTDLADDPEADIVAELEGVITFLNDRFAGNNPGFDCSEPSVGQISFCLARQDASGYTTPGYTVWGGTGSNVPQEVSDPTVSTAIQAANDFSTERFINVYVVEDIVDPVAGYATLPPSHGSVSDGIHVELNHLLTSTMVHEMGHYLGLFHTFGICQPDLIGVLDEFDAGGSVVYNACSCDNDNCLYNGDMVCDTPPNRMTPDATDQGVTDFYSCAGYNTCNTDALATVFDEFNLTSDELDDKMNYMDYPGTSGIARNHFTPGQQSRMCFMVHPEWGPRNTLLNNASCEEGCEPQCSIEILDFDYTLGNEGYVNSVQVDEYLYLEVNEIGCGFTNYWWSYVDLDNPPLVPVSLGQGNFYYSFGETGNYQVILTASNGGTCVLETTIDLQVLDHPGECPPNLDFSDGWAGWDRIAYHGGYLPPAVAETGPADPEEFDILTEAEFADDPHFGTDGLDLNFPNGVDQVMRVGRVIGDGVELPNSSAYYSTFTFTPSPDNSRIRIWYLGAKVGTNTPGVATWFLNTNGIMPSVYGIEPSYVYTIQDDDGTSARGGRHNANGRASRDRVGFGGYGAATFAPTTLMINDVAVDLSVQQDWNSQSFDFSAYACDPGSEVTITLYARTNTNIAGFDHAYAYFGIESCMPAIADPVVLDLPNIQLGCLPTTNTGDVTNCFSFDLPQPPGWDLNHAFSDYSNVEVECSLDGTTFVDADNADFSVTHAGSRLRLCNEGIPIKHFRITYHTLCGTYVDEVSIHSNYINQVDLCEEEQIEGGLNITAPQTPHFCPGDAVYPELQMSDPCWYDGGDPAPDYQWQILWGNAWRDLYFSEDLTDPINTENYQISETDFIWVNNWRNLVDRIEDLACSQFRRIILWQEPYCGQEVTIFGETINVQNLAPPGALSPWDFNVNDICALSNLNLEFDLTTAASGALNNHSQPYLCNPDLLENIGMPQGVTNTLDLIFHLNEIGNVIEVLPDESSPTSFSYENIWPFEANYVNYTFNNAGPDFLPIFEEGDQLIIEYSGTMFGCNFTYFHNAPSISALPLEAGEITAVDELCFSEDAIIVFNDGTVFDDSQGYFWQWSATPNFLDPQVFVGVEDPNLLTVPAGFFPNTEDIIYIRRVYNGTDFCPGPGFSNVVAILNTCAIFYCDDHEFIISPISADQVSNEIELILGFPNTDWVPYGGVIFWDDDGASSEFMMEPNDFDIVVSHIYPTISAGYTVTVAFVLYNPMLDDYVVCWQDQFFDLTPVNGIDCYFDVYPAGGIDFDLDGQELTITFDENWDPDYTGWDVEIYGDIPFVVFWNQNAGTFSYTYTFPDPGNYNVTVALEDNDWTGQQCWQFYNEEIYIQCPFKMHGRLWKDSSPTDGQQNPGESGFDGVPVRIGEYDAGSFDYIANIMTDGDGLWNFSYQDFTVYPDKDYYIIIDQAAAALAGLSLTELNVGNDSSDSDFYEMTIDGIAVYAYGPIAFNCDQGEYIFDAGFYQDCVPRQYRISGRIWSDDNESGTQQFGEPGMPSIPVSMLSYNGSNYFQLATDLSTASGYYAFSEVDVELSTELEYYLAIDDGDIPMEFQATLPDIGADWQDSDFHPQIINGDLKYVYGPIPFSCREDYYDYDAGFHKKCLEKEFEINGTVWQDADADGFQDDTEINLATIPVNVFEYNGSSFSLQSTAFSNGLGHYNFNADDFTPDDFNDYFLAVADADIPIGLELTIPNAGDDGKDSDFIEVWNNGQLFYVFGPIPFNCKENKFDYDLGLSPACKMEQYNLHGTAWFDDNPQNHQQDAWESGIADLEVQILTYNGTNYTMVYGSITNASGNWGLVEDDLTLDPELDYYLAIKKEQVESGLTPVIANVGTDDLDSDFVYQVIEGTQYYAYGPIDFDCDVYDYDFDIGFRKACTPECYEMKGTAWWDTRPQNNLQDLEETGYSGLRMQLLSVEEGRYEVIDQVGTDLLGNYIFSCKEININETDYYIITSKDELPSTVNVSKPDAGEDNLDSDFTLIEIDRKPYYAHGPIQFDCRQSSYDFDIGLYRNRYREKSGAEGLIGQLVISPNPAKDQSRVILPSIDPASLKQPVELKMYSLIGELVYEATLDKHTREHLIQFDDKLHSGLYVVEVLIGDQLLRSRLMMLKN